MMCALHTPPTSIVQRRQAMISYQSNDATRRRLLALLRAAMLVASAMFAVGCAPDSVRSAQATGFNAYVKQLPTSCKRLQIGSQDLTEQIMNNEMGSNDYNYFLDVTSKLYYNRMSQASYRQALVGFFGAGTYNDASFDCIFRTLPPDRPNAPVGTY
jgi:hypothetical protein